MNCPECEGQLTSSREVYSFADVKLGKYAADKCLKCGEIVFTDEAYDKAFKKARSLGLWGIGKVSKIAASGRSLNVTIPKKVVRFMGVKKGDLLWVHPQGRDKLVFEVKSRGTVEAEKRERCGTRSGKS